MVRIAHRALTRGRLRPSLEGRPGNPSFGPAAALAVTLAVAVTSIFVRATPASAEASIAVSPSSAPQGNTVTISGNVPVSGTLACASGDAAQLTSIAALFAPDGFGPQVPRDAAGNFQTSYTVLATTPAGSYGIGVRCGGGNLGISTILQVTKPPATTTIPSTTTTSTTSTTTPHAETSGANGTAAPATPRRTSKSSSRAVFFVLGALVLVAGVGAAAIARRKRTGASS